MPTPPPWCTDTQEAPDAVLTSALSTGQSAIASEPSRMPSVSRSGEATEPASRWSRPIATGAVISPRATRSSKAVPATCRSPYPSQQMRDGSPWPLTFSRANRIHRCSPSSSGNAASTASSVAARSAGSPDRQAQRNGPAPRANSGRTYASTKPG